MLGLPARAIASCRSNTPVVDDVVIGTTTRGATTFGAIRSDDRRTAASESQATAALVRCLIEVEFGRFRTRPRHRRLPSRRY